MLVLITFNVQCIDLLVKIEQQHDFWEIILCKLRNHFRHRQNPAQQPHDREELVLVERRREVWVLRLVKVNVWRKVDGEEFQEVLENYFEAREGSGGSGWVT